jgi:splicing factor 3B subunit 1
MAPEQMQQLRWERELEERNRYMADEELDVLIPGLKDGYEVHFPLSCYPIYAV